MCVMCLKLYRKIPQRSTNQSKQRTTTGPVLHQKVSIEIKDKLEFFLFMFIILINNNSFYFYHNLLLLVGLNASYSNYGGATFIEIIGKCILLTIAAIQSVFCSGLYILYRKHFGT